jgi:hypothetical protein
MSILRYDKPAPLAAPLSADEALLRLLLTAAGVLVFLPGWGVLVHYLQAGPSSGNRLLCGCGLGMLASAGAVLRWVLRPLWPRRYEGSAGVWGVMLLSVFFLVVLGLSCLFIWGCVGLARID